jgi:uncharacterized tellurite resistance protein B-like protein
MLWDLLDNDEKAKVIIRTLYHLAKTDGSITDIEFTYLVHVGKKMGFSIEDVRNIMLEYTEVKEILPYDEQDRMNVLYQLLFMMDADKNIAEEEEKALFHFGLKLGFSEFMIKDFMEIFQKHDIDDLPPEAMLNIIKKYQN